MLLQVVERLRCQPADGAIDNLSVNPARSIGPAIFVGGWALSQLWVFIVAPLTGAALAALLHGWLFSDARQVDSAESAVTATR